MKTTNEKENSNLDIRIEKSQEYLKLERKYMRSVHQYGKRATHSEPAEPALRSFAKFALIADRIVADSERILRLIGTLDNYIIVELSATENEMMLQLHLMGEGAIVPIADAASWYSMVRRHKLAGVCSHHIYLSDTYKRLDVDTRKAGVMTSLSTRIIV